MSFHFLKHVFQPHTWLWSWFDTEFWDEYVSLSYWSHWLTAVIDIDFERPYIMGVLSIGYPFETLEIVHHLLCFFFSNFNRFHIRNDTAWWPLTRLCSQDSITSNSTTSESDVPHCCELYYSHMFSWSSHQLIYKLVFSNANFLSRLILPTLSHLPFF